MARRWIHLGTSAFVLSACSALLGIEDPEHERDAAADAKIVPDASKPEASKDAAPDKQEAEATVPDVVEEPKACAFTPKLDCDQTNTSNCAAYGCTCLGNQCNGGACPGTGCSPDETAQCLACGCSCVDHACSGGNCPGTGCTPRETSDCGNFGCGCQNHDCYGGACT